jgi:hypothetical protein
MGKAAKTPARVNGGNDRQAIQHRRKESCATGLTRGKSDQPPAARQRSACPSFGAERSRSANDRQKIGKERQAATSEGDF